MKKIVLFIVAMMLLSTNIALTGDFIGKYCLSLTTENTSEEDQLTITAIDERNFSLN